MLEVCRQQLPLLNTAALWTLNEVAQLLQVINDAARHTLVAASTNMPGLKDELNGNGSNVVCTVKLFCHAVCTCYLSLICTSQSQFCCTCRLLLFWWARR